ncbi:MAG: metallophosphoesterase [Patescibacteria group bacterium]
MKEAVVLQTRNTRKTEEYARFLGRYGIDVVQDSSTPGWVDEYGAGARERIEALLSGIGDGRKISAVMRERSDIFEDKDDDQAIDPRSFKDAQPVVNATRLQVWSRVKGEDQLRRTDFTQAIEGYIDLDRISDDQRTFGWDDLFVGADSGLSLNEMSKRGIKHSGRDRALAKWIQGKNDKRKRKTLNHTQVDQDQTIDFRVSVADLIQSNEIINHPKVDLYGIGNLIRAAINKGIFTRSVQNRREGNAWHVDGNPGLPYTPKDDPIHEAKYMVHDLMHYKFGALIFDGKTDDLSRRTPIIHGMMSEAVTMVLADMVFVDTMVKNGTDYDFSKQDFYPLFESLGIDLEKQPEKLREMLYANVRYMLLGDDSGWRALGAKGEKFEKFKVAVSHFSIPDYEWTSANFDNMARSKDGIAQWRESTGEFRELCGENLNVQSVSEFIDKMKSKNGTALSDDIGNDQLIDLIFAQVFDAEIAPFLGEEKVEIDREAATSKGFLKYLNFQLRIFDQYDFIPEAERYRAKIVGYIGKKVDALTLEDIQIIRSLYSQFVDILYRRDLIGVDEQDLYKQFFPMFDPFYVNYHGDWQNERNITGVSNNILAKKKGEVLGEDLLGTYQVKGLKFHLSSDLHWGDNVEHLAERICSEKRADILFLLGDVFDGVDDSNQPKDTSQQVNQLLALISGHFKKVIFVPGNHDMRRLPLKENPWEDFQLPDNVVMPSGDEPIVEIIDDVKVLIGNLGYDMNFLDPNLVGLTEEDLLTFYRDHLPDGKAFLKGPESMPAFRSMTKNMAAKLSQDVDMVATHVPAHPSLVTFRVKEITPAMREIEAKQGVQFISDTLDDERKAKRYGVTPDKFREFWNAKSLLMGSNLLDPELGSDPKDGLTMLYGHNHRGREELQVVNGKSVRFITHQRPKRQ